MRRTNIAAALKIDFSEMTTLYFGIQVFSGEIGFSPRFDKSVRTSLANQFVGVGIAWLELSIALAVGFAKAKPKFLRDRNKCTENQTHAGVTISCLIASDFSL